MVKSHWVDFCVLSKEINLNDEWNFLVCIHRKIAITTQGRGLGNFIEEFTKN